MAQSVFSGGQTHAGGFRADQLSVTFGGEAAAGFLIQSVNFQYAQQVTTLYEIGSGNVYYVGGRAQGTSSLARVIGPAAFGATFIERYSDLCNPQDLEFDASAGCPKGVSGTGTNAAAGYSLIDAVMTTIAGSVTAQDVVINEQLQFMFIDLQIPGAA